MNLIKKILYVLEFILFYLFILVKSNLIIAYDILSPQMRTNPALIKVPITLRSDFGILLFSNLVSMTPGSLSLEISENKKLITVHMLYKKKDSEMILDVQNIQERIKKIIF